MERTALEEFIRDKFEKYEEVGDRHIFSSNKAKLSVSPNVITTYQKSTDCDGKTEYCEFCVPLDSIVFVQHLLSYTYGSRKEYIAFSLSNREEIQVGI